MDHSPVYDDCIHGIRQHSDSLPHWHKALQHYENKEYKLAVLETLNYMDPGVVRRRSNKKQTQFVIPHGSVRLQLTITDEIYMARAPFVRLPKEKVVPALRQATEINFSTLTLSQIVMKDDELHFQHHSPIDLCEPYKLYNVLREICLNADYYDDMFIDKFGASFLQSPEVEPYTQKILDWSWQKYNQYLDEAMTNIVYMEKNRYYDIGCDLLASALMKIDYTISPQGILRTELEDAISSMYNLSNVEEIVRHTKERIEKFKAYDRAKFDGSMYKPSFLIDGKRHAEIAHIQEILQQRFDIAKQERADSNYIGSTMTLHFAIYKLLFENVVPRNIEKDLIKGLKKAANSPWKSASDTLWKFVSKIMEMRAPDQVN